MLTPAIVSNAPEPSMNEGGLAVSLVVLTMKISSVRWDQAGWNGLKLGSTVKPMPFF
jgi:hypothetical protein